MTQVIYDKWVNGSLIKHEITEDENGHPTWRMIDSWVGLTDDEIAYIVNDTDTLFELEDFARAIEQALRIKNTS